jgi:hypothetical protein
MSTAAQLGTLLNTQADLNYYTMQLNFWSAKYEANSEKLQQQVKYEGKWESAFDSALDNTRELTACSNGKSIKVCVNNTNEDLADQYAHAKVKQYDEELSEELAELDIEYDTMKTMYETMIAQLDATEESEKSLTQKDAANTNLLQG